MKLSEIDIQTWRHDVNERVRTQAESLMYMLFPVESDPGLGPHIQFDLKGTASRVEHAAGHVLLFARGELGEMWIETAISMIGSLLYGSALNPALSLAQVEHLAARRVDQEDGLILSACFGRMALARGLPLWREHLAALGGCSLEDVHVPVDQHAAGPRVPPDEAKRWLLARSAFGVAKHSAEVAPS